RRFTGAELRLRVSRRTLFMDRTGWIAVTLCVVGLFAWQIWSSRQMAPRPALATGPSPGVSPAASGTGEQAVASPAIPQPTTAATAVPSATPVAFVEQTATLRNADVELHFTNRGGGIAQAILPNYLAEHGESVTLNAPERLPIGAIVDDPAAPVLPEYPIPRRPATVPRYGVTPG